MSKFLLISLISSLMLFTLPSRAEQKVVLGDYEVHYVAFNSTFIPAEVAKVYGLQRSRYNGLINITVLDGKSADKKPVAVKISGTARNLIGNQTNLEFKEIREGESVYYIAELRHSNEETFRFKVIVDDGKRQQTLEFQQKFYVD
ncbi:MULTISPECIES: DUF4426 domain-containing protein [unclassified Agarivorans]|uniref:DUF4426 domain-containing protein n=1 Tax=unclassified Agarivorans TaxID=2636026 RepID=UPI0010DC0601|nr:MULTISPECIES: DUF4426 domain-containing protein [unclassified Agarivorans]MDO6685148.1 DUF4426 domain-containing protein [Agarivorans sp. 3_MG-2023]MDO6715680.1 DUF4426 domain-containing protein [Agarivorans sp. 2_MG-2023]GDY27055.1 hypothetical protein AHAT_29450 [Agarivorans sp. Toyoura001]